VKKGAIAAALIAFACATTPVNDLPETRVSMMLQKTDGAMLSVAELRGRVVLLTVISTWADPALLEVPRLKKARAKYAPADLEIITIALDELEMAKIFVKTFEIPYLVAVSEDPAELTGKEGPLGAITIVPTSFLLDREGRIAARMEGMWPDELLEEALDRLVASGSSGP
jgi:peroxiredoxin